MPNRQIVMKLLLALLLPILMLVPARASAADEVVKSIEWEQGAPVFLYVEDSTMQAKVLAVIDGATAKKDVTEDAYWVSSNTSVAKVDKGLITPIGKGTAKITAKYKGFTLTLDVTSDYLFKELQLSEAGPMQAELGDTSLQLKAFAVEDNQDSNEVTEQAEWTSSNTSAATVSKGKLTLLSKGKTTITAKYKGLSDKVEVSVVSPYSSLGIEPAGMLEVTVGQTIDPLKAMGTLTSGAKEDVSAKAEWKTSAASIVQVDNGALTAVGSGTAKITAQYLGVTADVQVIVRLPYQALLLTGGEDRTMTLSDQPVQVQSFVLNDTATKVDVSSMADWTSSNPYAVTVQNGLISAKASGSSTITVTYRGLTKKFSVTVLQTMTSLHTDIDELTLFKGEVDALPAVTGTTLDEQELDVTSLVSWESSDSSILAVEKGKLTAKKAGTAKLSAKLRSFNVDIDVTVQEKVLLLQSSVRTYSIVNGKTEPLPTVKAVMEDGTETDVSTNVEWTSSSPNLLIKDRTVKALAGGRLNLTGKYLNKSITIPVTIEEEVSELTVEPSELVLNPGQGKSIKVTALFEDDKSVNVSSKIAWTSSDSSIVSVKGYNVKAVGYGTVKLTGSYQGKALEVNVKVVPRLLRVEASEKSLTLNIGDSSLVTLTAVYEDGSTANVTAEADWTSSYLSTATVSDGTITAYKKGYVTIKAIYNKKSVFIRVQVK